MHKSRFQKMIAALRTTGLRMILPIGALLAVLLMVMALTRSGRAENQADSAVYLPVLIHNFPFIPETPVLDPIVNADGDGSYTVSWSASAGAATYLLQEDDDAAFSSPDAVYTGANTSTNISGRDVGTYYYRVLGQNASASSGWSSAQSVSVTISLPPCLYTSMWYGATSQGYPISFEVENTPQCQIVDGSLKVTFRANCDTTSRTVTIHATPVVSSDHFDTGDVDNHQVIGDFSSPHLASGTYDFTPEAGCYASGTWEATNQGADYAVDVLAIQSDGKILVGGRFSTLGGQRHASLGRLNADGTLDTTFNPETDSDVMSLAVQADGKILVGGNFTEVNGQPRERIARLNADGTLDPTFNPGAGGMLWAMAVEALAVQADGKIIVVGQFDLLAGQAREHIGRLNPDGTLDATFDPGTNGRVEALAVLGGGKILVAGQFDTLDGQARSGIGRLNADGSLDDTFVPATNGAIDNIAVQSDGKVLIAGGGYYLQRLNTDGAIDPTFLPAWEHNSDVQSLAVQPDGKILVGGAISTTEDPIKLGRLKPDGSADATFNPVFDAGKSYVYVFDLKVEANNQILVGGIFYTVNGELRMNLVRLNPDGIADEPLPK